MAYSTGSGDYVALMAAVLVHALADGWTETGGLGTGWPIASPSGRVRGVDWTSATASEADLTLGGDGLTKTQRTIYIGLGTSGANATTNATSANTSCHVKNMAYTFTSWHIFSDVTVSDHIHVVCNFSNGATGDCYVHFSFGEIDKGGMTYNSIAYATTPRKEAYAITTAGGSSSPDSTVGSNWNTLNRSYNMWAGNYGENDDGNSAVSFMTHATTAPHLNGTGGWPAWDTHINSGTNVWAKTARQGDTYLPSLTADRDGSYAQGIWYAPYNSVTGQVSLGPIPFVLLNGTGTTARNIWMGVYPNVRFCSMDGVSPQDEIIFGGDTWKLFPMLRKTEWAELNIRTRVTSGLAGYAYKKV